MIQVGIAGIGFMGMIHFLAYQRVPGVRVAAICSRDQKKLAGDWHRIKGNFGPPGAKMDLAGIQTYQSLDHMLADPKLDLIDICLPPELHCPASVAAAKAGKHVFCEKPVALNRSDAQKMLRASIAANRQLLVGHIVPFFPEYAFALAAARGNQYGKLLGGHFRRITAAPSDITKGDNSPGIGAPVVDLHIHDAHFIRLLFGMPRAVFSRGRMHGGTLEYIETQYQCDDASHVVSAAGGVIHQPGRSFNQAFEIHFEQATLLYDFSVLNGKPHLQMPLTVLNARGGVQRPKLGSSDPADGFVAEIQEVVHSIRSSQPSPILSGTLAADALLLCEKETQSVDTGRLVKIR